MERRKQKRDVTDVRKEERLKKVRMNERRDGRESEEREKME